MPIAKKFSKVGLSLEYDTLTIYHEDKEESSELTPIILTFVSKCGRVLSMPFPFFAPAPDPTFQRCAGDLEERKDFQRFIHRDESDHDLYHRDKVFDMEENHAHFKHKEQITRDKLAIILALATKDDLITAKESDEFMAEYDKRYQVEVVALVEKLTKGKNKSQAAAALSQFVAECEDNTLLVAVHDHLLSDKKYEFLIKTGIFDGRWRGQKSLDGTIGAVSKTWANYEENTELKMIDNVQKQCQRFSSRIAGERADEFSRHPFFSIQRNALEGSKENYIFTLFKSANSQKLAEEYNKHFAEFKSSKNSKP